MGLCGIIPKRKLPNLLASVAYQSKNQFQSDAGLKTISDIQAEVCRIGSDRIESDRIAKNSDADTISNIRGGYTEIEVTVPPRSTFCFFSSGLTSNYFHFGHSQHGGEGAVERHPLPDKRTKKQVVEYQTISFSNLIVHIISDLSELPIRCQTLVRTVLLTVLVAFFVPNYRTPSSASALRSGWCAHGHGINRGTIDNLSGGSPVYVRRRVAKKYTLASN